MDDFENEFDDMENPDDFDGFEEEFIIDQSQGVTPDIIKTMREEWNEGLVQEYIRQIVKRLKAFRNELKKEGFSEEESFNLTLNMSSHVGLV